MSVTTAEAIVDNRKLQALQYGIAALCLTAQFVDGFDAQSMSFAAPILQKAWHLSGGALGVTFSATSVGTLAGCLVVGPLADRVGRKSVMVASLLAIAALMLATAFATTVPQLIALRFAAGLPLGALVPVAAVMANEWSPSRRRAAVVVIMGAGYPLGAFLGGMLSSVLLPHYGWPSVFVAGGAAAALIGLLLIPLLPESPSFVSRRGSEAGKARLVSRLSRVDPAIAAGGFASSEIGLQPSALRDIASLFQDGRGSATLLLWASAFLNMMVVTFVAHWLPTLLHGSGLHVGKALQISSLFYASGIAGVLALGALASRLGIWRVSAAVYFASAAAVALTGLVASTGPWITLMVVLTGFTVVGIRHSLVAMSTLLYPAESRSAGASWTFGVTHLGSITGPLIGGAMVSWGYPNAQLFLAMAAFSLIGAVLFAVLVRTAKRAGASA